MGCCSCRPSIDTVLNDPYITVGAKVGDIAFFSQPGNFDHEYLIRGQRGLMYVIDDTLYYESAIFGRLCCLCCRRAYKVRDITAVEVMRNQFERVRDKYITLRPGLKITVKPRFESNTIIFVAMPDAVEFEAKLKQMLTRH